MTRDRQPLHGHPLPPTAVSSRAPATGTLRPLCALAFALCASAALAACSDRQGGVSVAPSDDGTLPSGLYDASVEFDGIGRDVMYALVTDDGRFVEYDYQRDDVDQGADCHRVRVSTIAASADGYRIDDGTHAADFGLRASERGLEVSLVDTRDLDADGDTAETLVTVLERVDGLDAADLNDCA